MLTTLKNAFKIKDIRTKIVYTLFMLIVVRLGSNIPTPGVAAGVFESFFSNLQGSGGFADFFSAMTGGSFEKMSILALSITPYITSSIIMQLLTIAIPKLEEMQKDGEDGRKKIREITRYVTVALALIESTAMGVGFARGHYLDYNNAFGVIVVVISLTAGSAFLMWVGEQITVKGIGNGISIVLLINILSRIPNDFGTLFDKFIKGASNIVTGGLAAVIIIAVITCYSSVLFVLYRTVERRIPVQYSKKVVRQKNLWRYSLHIFRLKVNTAGVIPVIFASSINVYSWTDYSVSSGKSPCGFWGHVISALNSN